MKFLKVLLATILGMFIFFTLVFLIFLGIGSAFSSEEKVSVKDNSVLYLDLNRQIVEREIEDPFAELGVFPGVKSDIGLIELKRAIRQAKDDPKIKGIMLESGTPIAGQAKLEAIRRELINFKESGKFLVAYSESMLESGYYLASVADEIYVQPEAFIFEFNGLSYNMVFFKEMLDKIGVEPQIFKVGEYKSAAEPFTRNSMSEENREQIRELISSLYGHYLENVSGSRNIPVESLRMLADTMGVYLPQDAAKYGLITNVFYYDQVMEVLREKLELEEDGEVNLISFHKYLKSFEETNASANKIAVLVAEGDIAGGEGDAQIIGSVKYAKELRRLRDDKTVKAIVLRVNSPGGGSQAGDVIWREVMLAAEKKPVIASMGEVAASAGYLISVPADTIVAEPNTITGSIGVIGLSFNVQELLNEKLGIHSEAVKTGEYSDFLSPVRTLSENERRIFQQLVDQSYENFVFKVSEGRNMSYEQVEEYARGRVWTGLQAKERNLVDIIGGLEDAIEIAATKAGVADDYRVRLYPQPKTFLEQLMENIGREASMQWFGQKFSALTPYLRKLESLQHLEGIQARLPYELVIE